MRHLPHCAAMETVIASSEYAKPLDIFSDVKLVSQLSSWAQAPKIGTHTRHPRCACVCVSVCLQSSTTDALHPSNSSRNSCSTPSLRRWACDWLRSRRRRRRRSYRCRMSRRKHIYGCGMLWIHPRDIFLLLTCCETRHRPDSMRLRLSVWLCVCVCERGAGGCIALGAWKRNGKEKI